MRLLKSCLLLITISIFSLLANSCQKAEDSADVNQDRIHQYLELYYNSREDKTYAYAQFRFGNSIGTPLELSGAANVTVDGNTMSWNSTLNINRYEWNWTGKVSSATFVYSDLDGNVFTNTATINDIALPTTLDTISKAVAYNLAWVGNALSADEAVWVYINENQQVNGALFKQSLTNSTSITLTQDKLNNIDPNIITLWMDRHNNAAISQATGAGGILKARYRVVKDDVVLTN